MTEIFEENTASVFKQKYTYDRYGNRTIDAAVSFGGVNEKQFTVTAANNRLGVPSGQTGTMTYDAAGNLTTDTYSGSAVTRAYDADNRMTSETQAGSNVVGVYTYNADGQRVRRKRSSPQKNGTMKPGSTFSKRDTMRAPRDGSPERTLMTSTLSVGPQLIQRKLMLCLETT